MFDTDAGEELSVSQLNPSEPSAVSLSSSHMIVIIGCSTGAALTIVFITAVVFLRKRCQRSTANNAEHSDVKDGVAVIEGDESNLSHLHRQVGARSSSKAGSQAGHATHSRRQMTACQSSSVVILLVS